MRIYISSLFMLVAYITKSQKQYINQIDKNTVIKHKSQHALLHGRYKVNDLAAFIKKQKRILRSLHAFHKFINHRAKRGFFVS